MPVSTIEIYDDLTTTLPSYISNISEALSVQIKQFLTSEKEVSSTEVLQIIPELRNIGLTNLAWKLLIASNKENVEVRAALSSIYQDHGLYYSAHRLDTNILPKNPSLHRLVTTPPTVSVYVPCYNSAAYLYEVLNSILSQSYPVSEVIVIDDGSTDASREVVKQFPVKLIAHESNLGLSTARNTALQHSTSEFIAAIDSDTAPDTFWLERMMLGFETDSVAGIAGRLFESQSITLPDRWRTRMMPQNYGVNTLGNIKPFGCNSVYRRDILGKLGGYNPVFRSSYDDMDMAERVIKAGYETRYIPSAICRHLRSDTVNSVISSCYSWRRPGYELADAYSDPSRLAAKWVFGSNCDARDLKELCIEGNEDLSFISLLNIFHALTCDLLYYHAKHETQESLVLLSDGVLALLIALLKITNLSTEEHRKIETHILQLIEMAQIDEVHFSVPVLLPRLQQANLKDRSLEDVFEAAGIALTGESHYLTIALKEVLGHLKFDDTIWSALHASFDLLNTPPEEPIPHEQLSVNLSESAGKIFNEVSFNLVNNITSLKFMTSFQQVIETVSGYKPKQISLIADKDVALWLELQINNRIDCKVKISIQQSE